MGRGELLCVGDVHLGRRPGRVPTDLEGIEPRRLTPRAAFEAVVEEALAREVRAVLFAGDVVDAEDHFLEAYSVLEDGVRRLAQAGIEAIAVAGNHDVRALPRLADEVDGFRLLGRGGRWEQHLLRDNSGEPLARLVGWSFPRARVIDSPLEGLPAIEPAKRQTALQRPRPEATKKSRQQDAVTPSTDDTTIPRHPDTTPRTTVEAVRRAVKEVGKEAYLSEMINA